MSDSLEHSFPSSCHTALFCSEGRSLGCQSRAEKRARRDRPFSATDTCRGSVGHLAKMLDWVIRIMTHRHRFYIVVHNPFVYKPSKLGDTHTCIEWDSIAWGHQGLRSDWYSSNAEQLQSLDHSQPPTLPHTGQSPLAGWPDPLGSGMHSWSHGKHACRLWLCYLTPWGHLHGCLEGMTISTFIKCVIIVKDENATLTVVWQKLSCLCWFPRDRQENGITSGRTNEPLLGG